MDELMQLRRVKVLERREVARVGKCDEVARGDIAGAIAAVADVCSGRCNETFDRACRRRLRRYSIPSTWATLKTVNGRSIEICRSASSLSVTLMRLAKTICVPFSLFFTRPPASSACLKASQAFKEKPCSSAACHRIGTLIPR